MQILKNSILWNVNIMLNWNRRNKMKCKKTAIAFTHNRPHSCFADALDFKWEARISGNQTCDTRSLVLIHPEKGICIPHIESLHRFCLPKQTICLIDQFLKHKKNQYVVSIGFWYLFVNQYHFCNIPTRNHWPFPYT